MKFVFVNLNSAKEDWSESAFDLYEKKLKHFINFEIVTLKGENQSRSQKEVRLTKEAEQIMKFLKEDDFLVLFDEKGKSLNSIDFSKQINSILNSGKKRVVFLIGGAFGVSDEIKKRANLKISLSTLVFNHLVAQLVALEQLYRAFAIIKNLPYHNE